VDDHRIVRDGLKGLLEQGGDVLVVATAGTASEGLVKLRDHQPEVVVTDFPMPDHDGLWLLKEIKANHIDIPVIVLSMYDDSATVVSSIEAGASGYLPKSAEPSEVLAAIKAVHAGGSYVHPQVALHLIGAVRHREEAPADPKLSARELAVLTRLAEGRPNQEIADELHLSLSTVKAHLRAAFRKLNVSTRTELVIEAIRRGLIKGPS
jgi:DNA-binding NarL/FixJ family response regulator